jgi:hypothetical protein
VSALCAGIGLVLAWVQSLNPIFGVPVDHPASLVFIACRAVIGAVGILLRPPTSAELPPGKMHDEVKRLADAGETTRAVRLHRDLTGLDSAAAEQAVAGYLANRTRDPA